ncbi:MAG: O-antigen ligase family protein [Proteobacteria bacterium]|nr:O-antigen ligase family protein [Cystobacterineae bacterium]MCL2258773.1 O-antigen ligase family protein [Cystobacterineae bacterium]MCL2314400.1 O-antigen ligase family protein [Pseudomonadota bacterium]
MLPTAVLSSLPKVHTSTETPLSPICPLHQPHRCPQNLASLGLSFWGVGLLSFEALAHIGAGLCLLAVFWARPPWTQLKKAAHAWRWLLAFILWACLGPWCLGYVPKGSGVGRLLLLLALPVAAYAFFLAGPKWTQRVLLGSMALWLLSCLVAAFQHFGLWPSEEWFSSLPPLKSNFYRVYEEVPGQPGRYMAGGLLFHRLKFATVGSLFSLLSLGLALFSTQHRWHWVAVCVLGAFSVVWFPFARMAALSLCLALAFQLLLGMPKRKLALLCVCGLVLASALALTLNEGLRHRVVSSLSNAGSGNRIALWHSGWRAVQSSPLVGVGAGKFRPAAFPSEDMPSTVKEHPGKAHNQALTVAAESGLLGLLLAFMAFFSLAKNFWRQQHFGTTGLSILLFFALLSLMHDPLFQDVIILAFTWAAGVCLALAKPTVAKAAHPQKPTSAPSASPP